MSMREKKRIQEKERKLLIKQIPSGIAKYREMEENKMRCFGIFSHFRENTWDEKIFLLCFESCECITVIQTLAD